jgi:ribonuclease HI
MLYCDGGMNRHTGGEGWGSVVDQNGKDLVSVNRELLSDLVIKTVTLPRNIGVRDILVSSFTDVASQQTNGAELLAMLTSLRITKNNPVFNVINCDSAVILCWTNKGPQPQTEKKMDAKKLQYIREAITLRKEFESRGGKVVKISGDDNLADLGYH